MKLEYCPEYAMDEDGRPIACGECAERRTCKSRQFWDEDCWEEDVSDGD